jgi:choice-of-anchor C domain-containing protein
MKAHALAVAVAPLALFAAAPAAAAGFINGSFESSTCVAAAGVYATVSAGNGCITGWTVDSGSVDYINGYWEAKDGVASIDLAGNNPGTISQTFDTIAGKLYSVDYWLSGNPDGGSVQKFGVISAVNGSLIGSATFAGLQGTSRSNMNYSPWNFTFTATGPTTKLSFASNPSAGNFYGAALDAVSVRSAVPEPGTWALMLLGFGAVGFGMRRRRKAEDGKLRVRYAL